MAEGWTPVFSPVPQDHPLVALSQGYSPGSGGSLHPAPLQTDAKAFVVSLRAGTFLSQNPPHHSPEQAGGKVSFFHQASPVPPSVPRGLIKEDVGPFPPPRTEVRKGHNLVTLLLFPSPLQPLLYPRPASKSRNKYLFGASTQPLLCLPRVGWGQCLGPQSSPQ